MVQNIKKIFYIIGILLILNISLVLSHTEEDFTEAKRLIDSKTPCAELSLDQLELIGDYYMEQIHPGEQHEIMDEMMGGEGSESLRLMHIRITKSIYCGEYDMSSGGMMNMMYGGMMGMPMMNNIGNNNMLSYGMMGNNFLGTSLIWLIYLAIGSFIFGVIFWWTYNLIVKEKKVKK